MTKEKILLFGGTAETTEIAEKILARNFDLTVSTVSDDSLLLAPDLDLTRKTGRMNNSEIISYLQKNDFKTVICAVHPYASEARENIISACKAVNCRLLLYLRDTSSLSNLPENLDLYYADSHEAAAGIAASLNGNILLTTGSRNLRPYTEAIPDFPFRLFARVLNCQESTEALHNAHIPPEHSILARGPFSVDDNLRLISKYKISIIITKDGGTKGGTPQKLLAAAQTSCKVIMITRPQISEEHYSDIDQLIKHL